LLGNPLKANTSAIFHLRSYGYDAKNELRPDLPAPRLRQAGFQAITNHFTRYFKTTSIIKSKYPVFYFTKAKKNPYYRKNR
jgi:hypothetical protein